MGQTGLEGGRRKAPWVPLGAQNPQQFHLGELNPPFVLPAVNSWCSAVWEGGMLRMGTDAPGLPGPAQGFVVEFASDSREFVLKFLKRDVN